jgi:outer membrane protein assembly factor BamB
VADWTIRLPAATRDDGRQARATSELPPAMGVDRVYVLSVDNQLTGLRIEDGERVWQLPVSGDPARMLGGAPPAVRGSAVLAAFASGDVVALSGENGSPVWRDSLAPLGGLGLTREFTDIVAPPVMHGDRAFVTAVSGTTIALDMRRGARVWTAPVGGLTAPAVGDGALSVLDRSGRVAALTADRGRVVWWQAIPGSEPGSAEVWSGPVMVDGALLFVGSRGRAVFLDPATGVVPGISEIAGQPATPPVLADGRLFVVTANGDSRFTSRFLSTFADTSARDPLSGRDPTRP